MTVSAKVGMHLPFLRRYARALTGSQASGDAYVRNTLEAALADPELLAEVSAGRVPLYRAFSRIWSAGHVEVGVEDAHRKFHELATQQRLASMTPEHRQALLLTTLEDFDYDETAVILGCDPAEVEGMVAQAVAEIDDESRTDVLIIEDEPLISMQLEDLVSDLGHTVVASAATRTQAAEAFERTRPGLVLADIQLADGSSGIDAVEDILKFGDVPVIFITAYPEKLLTGDRPEPTYLVTKPFQEQTVRAAISQALFFGSSKPLS